MYNETQDNPVSFSTFCDLCPKIVLLLADSLKDQCRCVIHDNLFLKLDAIGILYDSSFWTKVLYSVKGNSEVYVGEVVKLFEASFQEVLVYANTKKIQAKEFEADKNKKSLPNGFCNGISAHVSR